MWIKNERWPAKTASDARASRVHSYDIESLSAKAEGEMRIGRIGAYACIPVGWINAMKLSKLQPKAGFEFAFGNLKWPAKNGDEAGILFRLPFRRARKVEQFVTQVARRLFRSHFVEHRESVGFFVQRRFRAETGELRIEHQVSKSRVRFGGERRRRIPFHSLIISRLGRAIVVRRARFALSSPPVEGLIRCGRK